MSRITASIRLQFNFTLLPDYCTTHVESFVQEIPMLSSSCLLSQGAAEEEEGEEEGGVKSLRTCALLMSITPRPDAANPAQGERARGRAKRKEEREHHASGEVSTLEPSLQPLHKCQSVWRPLQPLQSQHKLPQAFTRLLEAAIKEGSR